MAHLTEAEIVRLGDGSLEAGADQLAGHLAACAECRAEVDAQASAHRALAARAIDPVRDLSAAIRATLDAERPWIERLNWRRLSLRVAPLAAALTLVALFLVRTADNTPAAAEPAATDHTVASALYSGEVNEDQLLALFLSAHPDDALSSYVSNVNNMPGVTTVKKDK